MPKLRGSTILILIFLLSVIIPLSQATPTNVVIKLDNTMETKHAIKIIKEYLPNSIVVEYGSLSYYLSMLRGHSYTVWVGHGSQEFINLMGKEKAWSEFVKLIDMSPSKDIVLACNSVNLYKFYSKNDLVALGSSKIDARVGALLVSLIIKKDISILNEIFNTLLNLLNGKIDPMFLALDPGSGGGGGSDSSYWGTYEIVLAGADLGMILLSFAINSLTLLGAKGLIDLMLGAFYVLVSQSATILTLISSLVNTLDMIFTYNLNFYSTLYDWFIRHATTITTLLITLFAYVFNRIPWWLQALIGAEGVAKISISYLSVISAILGLAGAAVSFYMWYNTIVSDKEDSDDIYANNGLYLLNLVPLP